MHNYSYIQHPSISATSESQKHMGKQCVLLRWQAHTAVYMVSWRIHVCLGHSATPSPDGKCFWTLSASLVTLSIVPLKKGRNRLIHIGGDKWFKTHLYINSLYEWLTEWPVCEKQRFLFLGVPYSLVNNIWGTFVTSFITVSHHSYQ